MVDVLVVAAMVRAPVQTGILEGTGAEDQREQAHGHLRLEGQVREQPVVADRDAHHGGHQEKGEHRELEEVDAEVVEIERDADQGGQGGADQSAGPANAPAFVQVLECID